jgi:hypothetical protein
VAAPSEVADSASIPIGETGLQDALPVIQFLRFPEVDMSGRRLGVGLIALFTLCTAALAGVPEKASPFRTAGRAELRSKRAQAGEEPLAFDAAALASLRASDEAPFVMSDFPVAPGVRAPVVVRRFSISAPDARLRVTGPHGDELRPLPDVAHFAGFVVGEPESMVYLGARPDGMHAFVRSSAGTSYVGPDEAKTGFVVRDSASPANDRYAGSAFRCAEDQLPDALDSRGASAREKAAPETPGVVGFQKGALIVETDQELLAHFGGSIDDMTAYVLSLFAQVAIIDERDLSFHFTVIEVHAWTTPDPWDGPQTIDQLHQLGTWYHANRPLATYPRATVHLVSGLTVTGGVAWRPALCIADFDAGGGVWGGAYGMTQIFGNYPADKWDLHATAHELGHNQGSKHTHCYVPEIDQCYNLEGGCYSGATSLPPGGGTLMSYCNLLPGGEDNINLYFHQRCITEQMLPYIQGANCTTAVATFPDVPTSNPFFHYVETIYQLGITGGCSGGNYCPSSPVTRAQMAVFLLKAKYGSSHVPPACVGTFTDVPCTPGSGFGDWIEELASLGITGGCGPGLYCPGNTVTRKQMAPFLMKTLYGSSHVPPTCTGLFTDVPCSPGVGFDDFIEELYTLGITGGCVASPLQYCPDNPNTRAQMAVFLVKTFALVW